MASRSPTLVFFFFFFLQLLAHCLICPVFAASSEEEGEEFSEELLLKPLPDRKVLAHFHFDTRTPPTKTYGRHHRLFPKAIYQLVQKFRVREMELSFTQGRWNYERWGGFDPMSSSNAKPPGVELWAVFDVPFDQVDATWKNLTHALSGLFCASINFLQSSTAYSAPSWGFRSHSGALRYGALPTEAVCTENLTPWLKLLPCRDKAGLAAIMDRPSIYKGYYHSQRLRLFSTESSSEEGKETGMVLEQTLTVVLQPNVRSTSLPYLSERSLQPSWSIGSLFRRKVTGHCVLAKSSNVFLELERDLISETENSEMENGISGAGGMVSEGYWNNTRFELSVIPDKLIRNPIGLHDRSSSILYEFSVGKYSDILPLDVGIIWKLPVFWSCHQAPFHASRFLMGSGNERGSIAISLKSTQSIEGLLRHKATSTLLSGNGCRVRVVVFQVVPWYVKVYYHTLKFFVDGQPQTPTEVIDKIHVSPSEDKVSPGMLEMVLTFPCSMQSAALTLDFDKGFLHIDEYPPDANRGFDIPSAVISFPDFRASENFLKHNPRESRLLYKLQEKRLVRSYTEVLLVPLTTPDFSMPYNVITFTCTVLALYFGSLLNILRRRVGEEERFLNSQAAMKRGLIPQLFTKISARLRLRQQEPPQLLQSSSTFGPKLLFKVILVAAVAVGWHFYFK